MIAGVPLARARRASASVELRPVVATDRIRILAWNGDPEVRARSLDPRPIDPVGHRAWLARRLADPLTRMSIIERDGQPVGLVRVQRSAVAAPARISIVIDPGARGRGLGRVAIQLACRADGGTIVAEILGVNHASVACFAAAGFVPLSAAAADALTATLGPAAPGVARFLWRSHA